MAYDPAAYGGYPAAAYDPYAAPAYGAAPHPGYGAAPYHPAPSYTDEQRTIFITGFPADVKERELNNLLRFLPGYEASQMNWKNGQAQGFAMFANNATARGGCDAISQLCFDEVAVLRCEMARKNMYIKEDSVKRPRGGAGPPAAAGGASAYGARPSAAPYRPQSVGYVPITNTGDNPPCNTLFIGNLGDATDENELRGLFAAQPGFRQLKIVHGQKATSCFLEFADLPSAMAAHQSQQGAVLSSSDRGGLRIQYSKNPFGKKREYADMNARGGDAYGGGSGYAAGADGGAKPSYAPQADYQAPGADNADPAAPGV